MDPIIKPVFPLNIVAFPGERLNLHIFEPRYRQLFRECEEEGKTFIICPFFKGENIPYGTEMELIKIEKKYADGKMDVKTKGKKLVKIDAFYKTMIDKLYGGVEVTYLPWDDDSDFLVNKKILYKLKALYTLTNITNVNLSSPISFRTYQVAHKVGFSMEQEIEFLKISAEKDRQNFMIDHLNNFLPALEEAERMKRKALLNGHFKNVISPE